MPTFASGGEGDWLSGTREVQMATEQQQNSGRV